MVWIDIGAVPSHAFFCPGFFLPRLLFAQASFCPGFFSPSFESGQKEACRRSFCPGFFLPFSRSRPGDLPFVILDRVLAYLDVWMNARSPIDKESQSLPYLCARTLTPWAVSRHLSHDMLPVLMSSVQHLIFH